MIIGVDEVGRGCLAGPVCVAAVAWPDGAPRKGLADSKQLTAKKRVYMAGRIRLHAMAIGIGWVNAAEIDRIGIVAALKLAARQAVLQIGLDLPIVVDGRDKMLGDIPAQYIIKADTTVPAAMAASIIAKVARDFYMQAVDSHYAQYGFARHVGYGTAFHRQMIARLGPCDLHRMSYSPLKDLAA